MILRKITQMAGKCVGVTGQADLIFSYLFSQFNHVPVGLKLSKRAFKDVAGVGKTKPSNEIDGHVVCRSETGTQRVGPSRRQLGNRFGVHPGLPNDNRMPLNVDSPTPRPPRELGVFPGRNGNGCFTVEFLEFL
jgi:hypothetical protein